MGAVQRQGSRSIWRATYDIQDAEGRDLFHDPGGAALAEGDRSLRRGDPDRRPLLGLLLQPHLRRHRLSAGQIDLRVTKHRKSFLARKFVIDRLDGDLPESEEVRSCSAVLIMVLHERHRE